MVEQTLVLIKPDHVDLADIILAELDAHASRVRTARVESIPLEVIEAHYSVHRGRYFFSYMTASFAGRRTVVAVYEGEGVIQRFMELIGPADPAKAPKHTIRGKYGDDSLERAIAEKRPCRTVIHRSDSPEEFVRELAVWKEYLGV